MEFSSRDFCKLSVQDAADLLLEQLAVNEKNGKDYSCAKLRGCSDGRLFEMSIIMREVTIDGE